jgi:hypothetical protein
MLTRSLGDRLSPDPDVRSEELAPGDLLILATDGLFGKLRDAELLENATRGLSAQRLAEELVALGVERDGSDNVTVVIGLYGTVTQDAEPAAAPPATLPELPKRRSGPWLVAVAAALVLGFAAGFSAARAWPARAAEPVLIHKNEKAAAAEQTPAAPATTNDEKAKDSRR